VQPTCTAKVGLEQNVAIGVRAAVADHLGRAPRAELTAARRAAHGLAVLGRARMFHVSGADADAIAGDRALGTTQRCAFERISQRVASVVGRNISPTESGRHRWVSRATIGAWTEGEFRRVSIIYHAPRQPAINASEEVRAHAAAVLLGGDRVEAGVGEQIGEKPCRGFR
jgi:hypothetical protein